MRPTGEAERVGGAVAVGGREGVGVAISQGPGGTWEGWGGMVTVQGGGKAQVMFFLRKVLKTYGTKTQLIKNEAVYLQKTPVMTQRCIYTSKTRW